MRNLGRRSSQTCTTDTSHPPTSPGTDLADVAYQKHPCGGLAGQYFQHWKSQSLAPVSENCVFLGSKIYPKSFLKKSRFATVLEPFVGQLHFLPPHLRLLFQLLGSRSQHAIRAVLCWSLLILPFFLVWMPGGSFSLIFFHVQSIPPVCTRQSWLWSSSLRTISPAEWFTFSCFNWDVFDKEGYAFAPSVIK